MASRLHFMTARRSLTACHKETARTADSLKNYACEGASEKGGENICNRVTARSERKRCGEDSENRDGQKRLQQLSFSGRASDVQQAEREWSLIYP